VQSVEIDRKNCIWRFGKSCRADFQPIAMADR